MYKAAPLMNTGKKQATGSAHTAEWWLI